MLRWDGAGAPYNTGLSIALYRKAFHPVESTTSSHTLVHLSTTQTDKPKQIKLHAKGKAVSIACGYYHTAVVLGSQFGARHVFFYQDQSQSLCRSVHVYIFLLQSLVELLCAARQMMVSYCDEIMSHYDALPHPLPSHLQRKIGTGLGQGPE